MIRRIALSVIFVGILLVIWSGITTFIIGPDGVLLWSDWYWWTGWGFVTIGVLTQWGALVPAIRPTPDFSGAHEHLLDTELTQFNERGRHYGSQLWQVPFAYIGIVGAVLSQVLDPDKHFGGRMIFLALMVFTLFGVTVLLHMTTLLDGNRRAVANIQGIEAEWWIPNQARAQYKFSYTVPLLVPVILTVAMCAAGAMMVK